VGRGAHRAYAYLLYDRHHSITEVAQKRLQAIFEASELGAGFQIAVKDLEIRGAGNLLGAEQSGHIGAVGYELYSQMLSEAVKRMRALMQGEMPPPPPPPPVTIDLPVTAHIPEPYIADLNLRLAVYQRLSAAASLAAVDEIVAELTDRFGKPPPVVEHLLYVVRVRVLARAAGVQSITVEDRVIVLRASVAIANRERLRGAFGEQVQVGTAQVRVEMAGAWRSTLAAVLERLQPDWEPPVSERLKKPENEYGTFAVEVRGQRSEVRRPGGFGDRRR
jgi:transcription-repair coupling factor (superfamily II helicase)